MARIIIARAGNGRELEVEQSAFDAGFFPGYVYVRDATGSASSEPSAVETLMASAVTAGTGPLPVALRAAFDARYVQPTTAAGIAAGMALVFGG